MRDLMPLKSKKPISPFCTFDIEATKWNHFEVLGFYDGNRYERFEDLGLAMKTLFSNRTRNKLLFAHNLSYDGMFVLDYILNERPELKCVPILNGSKLIAIDVQGKSGGMKQKWRFRDSFSILPTSLKSLTNSFNVEHKKMDESEDGMISNYEYNKNDCIGLYEVLSKFFGILGGKVGMTISQTSLINFRERFQRNRINSVFDYEDMIRKSYYGGRTEIFRFNEDMCKKFYYFDINSLYPYCLSAYDYPDGKFRVCYPDIDKFGFSLAEVNDDLYFPLLPEKIEQKMLFRRGIKTGWYSNQELKRMEALGCEVKAKATISCDDHSPIFREFIQNWYQKRLDARADNNEALQYVCKLMMNSFYGKFAQDRVKHMTIIHPDKLCEGMNAVKIGRHVLYQSQQFSKASFIIPSISAMTTAYARLLMHERFQKAGEHLFYTDTDSCILDRNLFEHCKDMGGMKLEEEIQGLNIVLPKVYFYKDMEDGFHVKVKGIPMNHSWPVEQRKDVLKRFLNKETIEHKAGLWSLKKSIIASRTSDSSSILFPKEMTRTLRSYYDKRRIEEDYSCSPFGVNDDRSINKGRFDEILEMAKTSLNSF